MARVQWRSVLDVLETVAVIAASTAVVLAVVRARSDPTTRAVGSAHAPEAQDVRSQRLSTTLNTASTMGQERAKIAVIEFSDFQCPYCGKYVRETFPRLRADFVDTARIRFAYRHFPLEQIHKFANDAAKQAACASHQSQFWPMHDRLFDGQARFSEQFFSLGASQLHLNEDLFDNCLTEVSAEIDADKAEARRLGVTSTPTFFIGRINLDGTVAIATRVNGAYPYETFSKVIAALETGKSN